MAEWTLKSQAIISSKLCADTKLCFVHQELARDLWQKPESQAWLRERYHNKALPLDHCPLDRALAFLSGRLAARSLTKEPIAHEWRDGRPAAPYVAAADGKRSLSISHSGKWAVAAMADKKKLFGVDLEKRRVISEALMRKHFSPAEVEQVSSEPDKDLGALNIWTAKESVLKALKLGLAMPLRNIELRRQNSTTYGVNLHKKEFVIESYHLKDSEGDDYVLSLAQERIARPQI